MQESSGGKESGGKSGFQKPYRLSEAMSEFMNGEQLMSRPELTKRFWEYFRQNNLQDPKDKR
jgi:upstream activation factor subunit UAF30